MFPWAYLLSVSLNADGTEQSFQMYLSEAQGPMLIGGNEEKANVFRLPQTFIDPFFEIVFSRIRQPIPQDPFTDNPLPESTEAQ